MGVRHDGGYGAVWAERPARRRLLAPLVPAALVTFDVAVPSLTRAARAPTGAVLRSAALAASTATAGRRSGRRAWRGSPTRRAALLPLAPAAAAAVADRPALVAAVLVLAGMAVGALFATLSVVVDQLRAGGAGTRAYAWLVTADDAGIARAAAPAGALIASNGSAAGLRPGVGRAPAGIALPVAAVAAAS